jgi:hypothetical protein
LTTDLLERDDGDSGQVSTPLSQLFVIPNLPSIMNKSLLVWLACCAFAPDPRRSEYELTSPDGKLTSRRCPKKPSVSVSHNGTTVLLPSSMSMQCSEAEGKPGFYLWAG